jgi:hypothetical protein|tara:strand:+ start:2721 stop:2870 length:150 start_codon:yes stop_codon:yes gene_type:complete
MSLNIKLKGKFLKETVGVSIVCDPHRRHLKGSLFMNRKGKFLKETVGVF